MYFFMMKIRTFVILLHPAVPIMPCVCRRWMHRHREAMKPVKTPIKHTHIHTLRWEYVCVVAAVQGLSNEPTWSCLPTSLPPDLLPRSLAPTTVTWPITAGRCDGQPSTPRTRRAEGLGSEDKRSVNEGLWRFDWRSELMSTQRDGASPDVDEK